MYLEDGTLLKDDRVLDSDIVKSSVVVLALEPPKEILVVPSTPDASPNFERVQQWTNNTFPGPSHVSPSSASSMSEETSSQRSTNSVFSSSAEISPILKLPDFTSGVRDALLKNESAAVWSQVVTQSVDYYRRFYPDRLQCSEDYRLVGQMMLRKYPSIARFGKHPYTAFTHAVSSRMRSIRHQNKRKSEQHMENSSDDGGSEPKSKRKLSMVPSLQMATSDELISKEEYEAHKKEMSSEMQKDNVCVSHLRHILKLSFHNRVVEMKHVSNRLMYNMVKCAPALQRGDMILEEFKMMKGWTDKDIEDGYTRICKIIDIIKSCKNFNRGTSDMTSVMALRFLEKQVGFKRGRGGKYKNVVEVKWEVGDERIGEELEKSSSVDDSPKLIIFSNSENVVLICLVGDGTIVNIDGTDVCHALLVLMSVYYILDMRYPRCYSQFLGILQEIVMKEKFIGKCSSGMVEWMSKFTAF